MGKKRADSPQLQEEESLKEQLREYIQWEEATKNLLSLLQAKAAGGHQPPPQEPLSFHQPAWDSEDTSNFKDAGSRLKGTVNMPGRWRSGEVGWGGSGRRVGKLEGGEVCAGKDKTALHSGSCRLTLYTLRGRVAGPHASFSFRRHQSSFLLTY